MGPHLVDIDPNGYFWGWLKKAAKKALEVVQKVADVVSFVLGIGTVAGFVSLGCRVAGDVLDGGTAALKRNWKSYAVDAAICATGIGGVGKAASRALVVVAKKASGAVAKAVGEKAAAKAFSSFGAFKKVMGRAGDGKDWRHIVEQGGGNAKRFGPEAIHNTRNVVRLDRAVHKKVSGFYSSKQLAYGGGQTTVRKYVRTLPYEQQRQIGVDVLSRYGVKVK